MATNILNSWPGYRSDLIISHDYKVCVLAQMLSGYNDVTWNKLKRDRKLTYIRAASTLLFDWQRFEEKMKELNK